MLKEFIPIYCKENLILVNPHGSVGVVTLWTRKDFIYDKLKNAGIDMNSKTSPIAAIGNLYGNGIKYLIANLLYNPQIRYLFICGTDRFDAFKSLFNFFNVGIEECNDLGIVRHKIIGTDRVIDSSLNMSNFLYESPKLFLFDLNDSEEVLYFFDNLPFLSNDRDRIEISFVEAKPVTFPSNPRSHVVIKKHPLSAWKELIFCINRFGHPVDLGYKKGKRIELQNVKVIVEHPREDSANILSKYGFSLNDLKTYQRGILDSTLKEGEEAYNYGNRMRSYFGYDTLSTCISMLKSNKQSRQAYISTWDAACDFNNSLRSSPCLVSVFFRVFDDKLTLTAVFRTHNAVSAWLQNFYGLMAIQTYVSNEIEVEAGAITIISHSISINTVDYDVIYPIIKEREKVLTFDNDPNGNFRVSIENGFIIVRHYYNDEVINKYISKKAERIQYELKRDRALSDIAHAIFIGRQLAKAEMCIESGEPFIEYE